MMGLSGLLLSVMSVASLVAASALSHRCMASAFDLRALMSVSTPTCASTHLPVSAQMLHAHMEA